jgi:phospholipase C
LADCRLPRSSLLSACGTVSEPYEAPLLPDTTGQFNLAQFEASQLPLPSIPGSKQTIPTQERGHRKRVGGQPRR